MEAAMVKFVEMRANDGLDPDASPRPWLMVRLASIKQLFLRGSPPGKKVTVKSDDPRIAEALFIGGVVTIRGHGVGTTQVWAEVGGIKDDDSVLDVNVKATLTKKISFTFVSDTAGHHTTRNRANVDGLIAAANLIYLPQVNVHFVKGKVQSWQAPLDLGDPVTWDKGTVIFPQGDGDADCNCFFVWEYEDEGAVVDNSPGFSMAIVMDITEARAEIGGTNCIIEDHLNRDAGALLAHEAGHMLGCADREGPADGPFLMFNGSRRGTKIPKSDANIMNPWGVPATP
jgi:hypothetical protein